MLAHHYQHGWLLYVLNLISTDASVPVLPTTLLTVGLDYQLITTNCCNEQGTSHQNASQLDQVMTSVDWITFESVFLRIV